jgi:hypothetical protein
MAGGVVVLVLLGVVIWRIVVSAGRSASISGEGDMDLIPEEVTMSDGMPETINFVTESNAISSEANPTTVNLLDDSDDGVFDD